MSPPVRACICGSFEIRGSNADRIWNTRLQQFPNTDKTWGYLPTNWVDVLLQWKSRLHCPGFPMYSSKKVERAVWTLPSSASIRRRRRSASRCAVISNHHNAWGKRFHNVLAMKINDSYNLSMLHLTVKDLSLKSSLRAKSPSLSCTKGTQGL